MKYLILILSLMFTGCVNSKPECMDGFHVWHLDGTHSFCRVANVHQAGVTGRYCYDFYENGESVIVDMVMREGRVAPAICYDTRQQRK